MAKRLIVVDISSFIFRAFFAIRPMHAPDGTPVNAVYGVLTMMLKILNSYNPSHIILAQDVSGGSFRNEIYPEYKANRGAPPEELIPQFALIEELLDKLKIPHKGIEKYEADDIIGSLVVQFKDEFDEVLIASGDKDLMQFVDEKVKMLDTMKDKTFGIAEVKEKMGVFPNQIMDYLSLLGDSSDNIPGVRGIGAKGAAKLLEEYKTLDSILENIGSLSNKRANTALEKYADDATLSKKLVKIVQDIKLNLEVKNLAFKLNPDQDLFDFLDKLNFKSLKTKLASNDTNTVVNNRKSVYIDYQSVKTLDKYQEVLDLIAKEDQIYFEAFFPEGDYHKLNPSVMVLGLPDKVFVCYVNEIQDYTSLVRPLLESEILIASNEPKALTCVKGSFERRASLFDITQAHFCINPDLKHNMQSICLEFLNESVKTLKELSKESLEQEASIQAFELGFARRGYWGVRVYPWLQKKLEEEEVQSIYDLDMKLLPILSDMEMKGIHLNTDFYAKLEKDYQDQLDIIETKIKDTAGEDINIRSPKQLGVLLFEKLELPVIKKTKTGYSTDVGVLEELKKMEVSEIPALILKYRELDKLLSTYVKTFPKLVNGDGKIHTHFMQSVAATGRLSSENPNLQNIPIRTENGRMLRKGFEAQKGHKLLGADYSQVELRILAHFSEDKVMVSAFNNDEDIHAQTAAEVFSTDLADVSKDQRSFAKAINFGLMYGQSSFGLSQTLGISMGEAKSYITDYFTKFSKVKHYLDGLKEECEKEGFSKTLMGRKRIIKDINSTNRQMKSMAERMAINSPIQGTASDIIKKAMIEIDQELQKRQLSSKMILQVHDELIFEVPDSEVDEMEKLVRDKMESVVTLKVPLKVDVNIANNWYELK